jgi:hypothetical protein
MSEEDDFWIICAEPEDWSSVDLTDLPGSSEDLGREFRRQSNDLVARQKILGR